MKRNYFKLFIFTLAVTAIAFNACKKGEELDNKSNAKSELPKDGFSTEEPNEFKFLDKKYNIPAGLTKWEAQLNKMIENNHLLMKNGLKLVNYNYVRNVASVSDLETVKRELNDDNSFFLAFNNDRLTDFTIGKNEELSKNYMKVLNYLLPTSESAIAATLYKKDTSLLANAVYVFEKDDMGIVGLTWEYKGETLNTTCLVSKRKGFVYDKLLFWIPFETKHNAEIKSSTSSKSNLKDTPPPPPDGPVSCAIHPNERGTNSNGSVVFYEYRINIILHGQRTAGVKYASSPDISYYSKGLSSDELAHYIYGTWDCKAEGRVLDYKEGPNGYLRYAYVWSYKHNGLVSISWNGFGYNVTGGGTSGGNEGMFFANDMN